MCGPQDEFVSAPLDSHPDKLRGYWEEQALASQQKGQMLARQLEDNNVSMEIYS